MLQALPKPFQAATERMRFVARVVMLLFVVVWISWFFPFDDLLDRRGTPLGADFSMFYIAGRVAGEGHWERLYDQAYHQQQLRGLFPQLDQSFYLPYRYPPWVAMAMAPFARLPYAAAFALFFALSFALWLVVIGRLMRQIPLFRGPAGVTAAWALAGWPVVWESLIGGQASLVAAGIAVTTLLLLRHDRPVAAGMILALAAYKPNVLALFALGVLVRYPRMLWGLIPSAMLLMLIVYGVGAGSSLEEYASLGLRMTSQPWDVETPYWKVHGLSPWLALLSPRDSRLMALGLGVISSLMIGVWWRWNGADDRVALPVAAAGLLVVNTLFNPYVPIYDLVLLGPAAVWGSDAMRRRWPAAALRGDTSSRAAISLQLVFVVLFFGPHLSQALAKGLGVQLFPLALLAIAVVALRKRDDFDVGGTEGTWTCGGQPVQETAPSVDRM